MHDLLVGVVAFLLGELQVALYLYRANKERDAFLRAFEKHLWLYKKIHRRVGTKIKNST